MAQILSLVLRETFGNCLSSTDDNVLPDFPNAHAALRLASEGDALLNFEFLFHDLFLAQLFGECKHSPNS